LISDTRRPFVRAGDDRVEAAGVLAQLRPGVDGRHRDGGGARTRVRRRRRPKISVSSSELAPRRLPP